MGVRSKHKPNFAPGSPTSKSVLVKFESFDMATELHVHVLDMTPSNTDSENDVGLNCEATVRWNVARNVHVHPNRRLNAGTIVSASSPKTSCFVDPVALT